MWKPEIPSQRATSPLLRYGLAVISVVGALALALFAQSYSAHNPEYPMLLIAIAITIWYAGQGPGALAVILASTVFNYFFTEPRYTLYVAPSDRLDFVLFVVFALLIGWFAARRQELQEVRNRLQVEVAERTQQASLLNLTHDTIFVRDMNDVITYWNRGAQELYGWTAEAAVGKRVHELLHTVFPLSAEEIRAELLRSGRWDGELQTTKADGTQVIVSSRWSLRQDEQQRPVAILETNNDITERKKSEDAIHKLNQDLERRSAELEATNKELEAFAYSISHDLRAPLRHMAGYAELLQKHTFSILDEKGRRYMVAILESAKRMGELIDDLLTFSRIGRAETQKTVVSLDQLLREVLREVQQETDGRTIGWKIGALPNVYGDRSMLRVALVNLLSNAVKFTRKRAQAEIEIGSTNGSPDEVVFYIKDNGVGFDMRYVNKLFRVFQRLHRAEDFEGTGIGLATVQRIIQRHGGRIWAEGEVERGATFYFAVPKP
jgi:PAS domain S-box-containing protein